MRLVVTLWVGVLSAVWGQSAGAEISSLSTAAIELRTGTIETGQTWPAGATYHLLGAVSLAPGVSLCIEPGAVVKFDYNSYLDAGAGILHAQGRGNRPIIFTDKNDDSVGQIIPGSTHLPANFGWMILIRPNSLLEFCQLRYGGGNAALTAQAGAAGSPAGSIRHNQFWNCYPSLRLDGPYQVYNNLFSGGAPMITNTSPGDEFTHNTFHCTNGSGPIVYNRGPGVIFRNNLFTNAVVAIDALTAGFLADHNAFYRCPYPILGQAPGPWDLVSFADLPYADPNSFYLDQVRGPVNLGVGTGFSGFTTDPNRAEDIDTPDIGYHYPLLKTAVTRPGFTWRFNDYYHCGTYVNGDWWAIGPLSLRIFREHAEPLPPGVTGNGSQINPDPKKDDQQGYDSRCSVKYNPALNRGSQFSVTPAPGRPQSVFSVCSYSASKVGPWDQNVFSYLKEAAVLTVLDPADLPRAGDFRPCYVGDNKPAPTNISQIRLNPATNGYLALGNFPAPSGTNLAAVETYFERVWMENLSGWTTTDIIPNLNQPAYGVKKAELIVTAGLYLNLDLSRKTLLIRFLQYAIDIFGLIKQGGLKIFYHDGGHGNGRKLAILMAGAILDAPEMLAVAARSGDYSRNGQVKPDHIWFGEDDQTFYVSPDDVNPVPLYCYYNQSNNFEAYGKNSDFSNANARRDNLDYTTHHLRTGWAGTTMPEWGVVHLGDSYRRQDNACWDVHTMPANFPANSWYRQTTGENLVTEALAARMTARNDPILATGPDGLKGLWNHNALFDYADRYFTLQGCSDFIANLYRTYHNGTTLGPKWVDTVGYQTTCVNAPASLVANNLTGTTLDLIWPAVSGADSYRIIRFFPDNRFVITSVADQVVGTSYHVAGLAENTRYVFRIFSLAPVSLIQSVWGPVGKGWAEAVVTTGKTAAFSAPQNKKGHFRNVP